MSAGSKALLLPGEQDRIQMPGQPKIGTAGFQALETYIYTYLYENPKGIGIEEKRSLRICCKRFKGLFDATITSAKYIGYVEYYSFRPWDYDCWDEEILRVDKIQLIHFQFEKDEEGVPESFLSLDRLFQTFTSLETLTICGEQWRCFQGDLPESIGNLRHLRDVSIHIGLPVALPLSLSKLTSLNSLSLNTNPTVQSIASLEHCTALEILRLSFEADNEILKLPECMGNLTSVRHLELFYSGACSLPESMGNLNQLRSLTLHFDHVVTLPESFGDMLSLSYLALDSSTGLKHLPNSFENLTELNRLSLYCGELETLPVFSKMKKLRNINIINCNKISEINDSIAELQSLESLLLERCKCLTALPDCIAALKSLIRLDIDKCPNLVYIPTSITKLSKLRTLQLMLCPQVPKPAVEAFRQHFGTAL